LDWKDADVSMYIPSNKIMSYWQSTRGWIRLRNVARIWEEFWKRYRV